VSEYALRETTLRSLGLTSGTAVIRYYVYITAPFALLVKFVPEINKIPAFSKDALYNILVVILSGA